MDSRFLLNYIEDTTNSIFSYLSANYDVPWKNVPNIGLQLDNIYFNQYAHAKLANRYVMSIKDLSTLPQKISDMAFVLYKDKWLHNWGIIEAEYNPIDNYNMREEEQIDDTKNSTESLTGDNESQTNGTDTQSGTNNTTDKSNASQNTVTEGGKNDSTLRTPNLTTVIDTDKTDNTTRTPDLTTVNTKTGSNETTNDLSNVVDKNNTVVNDNTNVVDTEGLNTDIKDISVSIKEATENENAGTGKNVGENNSSVYGFNSTTAVPTDAQDSTIDNSVTNTDSGTKDVTNATKEGGQNTIKTNETTKLDANQTTTEHTSNKDTGTVNVDINENVNTKETGTDNTDTTITENSNTKQTGTENTETKVTENMSSTVTNDGSNTTNNTISFTNDKNQTTKDTNSYDKTTQDKGNINRNLTRKGNIGVTTTQQMLTQEFDFWKAFNYFQSVFADIDKLVALDIF